MRLPAKSALVILCGLSLSFSCAQEVSRQSGIPNTHLQNASADEDRDNGQALSPDDRLSIIASALDARVRRNSERDCSHLVYTIYRQAGFPYSYAPSSEIYAGIAGFGRVKKPQPGDLVVWRGHVGIVIKPSQHIFFSFLSSGPGTDDYSAPYWKSRGKPRFYRYLKDEGCGDCGPHQRRLLNVKK